MILFWGDWLTLLSRDERLEQPNSCTVNVTGDECHPDALVPGYVLQITDEKVSFPLHGLGLDIFYRWYPESESHLVATGCPVIVLRKAMRHVLQQTKLTWLTRSSNSSASALNLLTNPERPNVPFLPRWRRGLNFESRAVSRKTIRGYAMGIPVQFVYISHNSDVQN